MKRNRVLSFFLAASILAINPVLVGCDEEPIFDDDTVEDGDVFCWIDLDSDTRGSDLFQPRVSPDGLCVLDASGNRLAMRGGDCDDFNPTVYVGAPEIDDDLDNDCDGYIDEGGNGGNTYVDLDNDGWSVGQGDCDDYNASRYPGALEHCADGIDNDCDGLVDSSDSSCQGNGGNGGGGNNGGCSGGRQDMTVSVSGLPVSFDQVCLFGAIDGSFSWGLLGCGAGTSHSVTVNCVAPNSYFEFNWGMVLDGSAPANPGSGYGYDQYSCSNGTGGVGDYQTVGTVGVTWGPQSVTHAMSSNDQETGCNHQGVTPG